MELILGSVNERYRAVARGFRNFFQIFVLCMQLLSVALLKFGPPYRVVPKPLAKLGRGGKLLRPSVELRLLLADSAWPEPIHEDSLAVLFGGWIVGPLDLDHFLDVC